MGYMQARKGTESPAVGPAQAAPTADHELGGAEAWGNAALAEQIPAVGGGGASVGSGGPEADPWWGRSDEEEEPVTALASPNASFREEIAKPAPNPKTVYDLLRQMVPANVQAARNDPAIWAKVVEILTPEQLAKVESGAIGVPPEAAFSLRADFAYLKGVETLQERVAAWVEKDLGVLIEIYGVNGIHEPTTKIQPQSVAVTLGPQATSDLGLKDPEITLWFGGTYASVLSGDGMLSTTVSSVGAGELTVRHPRLGDTVFPAPFAVPEFKAWFVGDQWVKGSPTVVWG